MLLKTLQQIRGWEHTSVGSAATYFHEIPQGSYLLVLGEFKEDHEFKRFIFAPVLEVWVLGGQKLFIEQHQLNRCIGLSTEDDEQRQEVIKSLKMKEEYYAP